MKRNTATVASFLRPAAAAVLLLLFFGWDEQAWAHPVARPLSPVLRHPQTYKDVGQVSEHVSGQFDCKLETEFNNSELHLNIVLH